MSNDESVPVPHKTTSSASVSSQSAKSPQEQSHTRGDSETATSSRHSSTKRVPETAISSDHNLAKNSQSKISDWSKSTEQVAYSGEG